MNKLKAAEKWLDDKLEKALLTPIKSLKKRYIPLLLIYFAYGAAGFTAIAETFWVKENLSLSAEQLLSIGVWVSLPWTLKMIFGQMVDNLTILGSRRKIYVFLGAALMALGTVFLASLAGGKEWVLAFGGEYGAYFIASILAMVGFMIQDVTADTMSTEVVERHTVDSTGKKIERSEKEVQSELAMVQVLGRLALSFGILSVVWIKGDLAEWAKTSESFGYADVFWLSLIIPVISCLGALFVRLEETPKKVAFEPKILGGGVILGIFVVCMGLGKIFYSGGDFSLLFQYSEEISFFVTLAVLAWMIRSIIQHLDPAKLKVLVYTMIALFLYRLTPGVGPGLSWWFIDVLHFDPAFFEKLSIISAIVPLVILWLFSEFISKSPIRMVLLFLIAMEAIMSMPEILLFYGGEAVQAHARVIALFDTAVSSPLVNVSMVPLLALLAFYAPAGYRGTWFAVGASLMNLALTGGTLITKYLNQIFVVTRDVLNEAGEVVTAANYASLGNIMIVKILISFVIPLVAVLIFLRKPPQGAKVQALESKVAQDLPEDGGMPSREQRDI